MKMTLTFTILNLLILLVLLLLTVTISRQQSEEKFRIDLENTTDSVSIQISEFLDQTINNYLKSTARKSYDFLLAINANVSGALLSRETAESMFFQSIREQSRSSIGTCIIVDNDGKVIFDQDSSKIGTESRYRDWIRSHIKEHYILYRDVDQETGEQKVAMKFYFSSWDWQVIYEVDYYEVYSILDFDSFNASINNIRVGEKGYPYIISTHGLVITHPDDDLRYDGIYNLLDNDGFAFVKHIINERSGFLEYNWLDKDGVVRVKVANFKQIPNTHWIVVSGGYKEDFFAITNQIRRLLIMITIASILISILFTLLFSGRLVVPISLFNTAIKDISEGEGDLTQSVTVQTKDEMQDIATDFNLFIRKLRNIISQIKSVSNTTLGIKQNLLDDTEETNRQVGLISENVEQINFSVKRLGNTVGNARTSVDKIISSINGLSDQIVSQNTMIEESSASITQMISSIDSVADITSKKQAVTEELVETTKKGLNVVTRSMDSVQEVNNQLEGINNMATVISDIAEQTNILSMNAAIEAAHAGEFGKGFAIVAEQIRSLAASSNVSSNNIKELLININRTMKETSELSAEAIVSIQEIEVEINRFVQAFEEINQSSSELKIGGREIIEAIQLLRDTSAKVDESSSSIKNLTGTVEQAVTETSTVSEDVIMRVSQISSQTGNIIDSMKRVNNSTKEIENAGNELDEQVRRFKV